MNTNNIYIPNLDAKDIYIANNYIKDEVVSEKTGYNLYKKDGTYNLRKFISTLDFSLDSIKLREVYYNVYRKQTLTFYENNNEYSYRVINVTFNYSNKDFNKIKENTYVKFGYKYDDLKFNDSICVINNEVVGVMVNSPIKEINHIIEKSIYFGCTKIINKDGQVEYMYNIIKTIPTRDKVSDLRKTLYTDGFYCNGIKYVRFKRSSGSSRVGKCLFIDENLYSRMHKWEMCGLKIEDGDKTDLAALEAYISLPTSSIIDVLHINPKSILVMPDFNSKFEETVIATYINDEKHLETNEQKVTITNSIWDGQSLVDSSVLGKYKKYGMVLLRNRFFKSCCFNTNIQKWFGNNHITDVSQLNGFTLAKKIEDIKLITTPNSIKYLKFGKLEEWLQNIDSMFGVVKHEKPTHNFDGRMVQTHYQLLNTLQLSYSDVCELVKKSLDYINLLNNDVDVLKYHINYSRDDDMQNISFKNKNEIIYNLLDLNAEFSKTKLFYGFKRDLIKSYLKNIKCGHILINGTYAILCGNPIEMLQHSINKFEGNSILGIGNVCTKKYKPNTQILGCRSPHVTMGNILVANNINDDLINTYMNLTEEIVCINSIGENILERLSSADFDSDQMIISNEPLILQAALKNYELFKVPTSLVEAKKTNRLYTNKDKADLDIKTSVNKIGEIINLSQELNTLLWHLLNNGKQYNDIEKLYWDIAKLDVMSCIEIDMAKKEFEVNNTEELKILKNKYNQKDTKGRVIKPNFFGFINKTKGYYNPTRKNYKYHDTSMDYLHKYLKNFKSNRMQTDFIPFTKIFEFKSFDISMVNYRQVNHILDLANKTASFISLIWSTDDGVDKGVKYEIVNELKYKLFSYIDKMKLNLNTTYYLISCIDREDYSKISKLLFYIFFQNYNSSFYELLKASKCSMKQLTEDIEGDIKLYDFIFKKA